MKSELLDGFFYYYRNRIFFLLFHLLVLPCTYLQLCTAQTIELGNEQLKEPMALYVKYGEFYMDLESKQGVEKIAKQQFHPFSYYFKEAPKYLPPGKTLWIKLQIKSSFARDTTVIFYPGAQNRVDLYLSNKGFFEHVGICGNLVPGSRLSIKGTREAARMFLTRGELNVFLISIRNYTSYHTDDLKLCLMSFASLTALQAKNLQDKEFPNAFFFTALGMFLIMFIYIGVCWMYTKDDAYLFYALTIFCSIVFFLLNHFQTENNALYFNEHPLLLYLLQDAFTFLSLFAYWQFVRKFLYIDSNNSGLGKFMRRTAFAILAFLVVSLAYGLIVKDLTALIKLDTAAGAVLLFLGTVTMVKIWKVKGQFRTFIFGGIFSLLFFYTVSFVYELVYAAGWSFVPNIGGGIPIILCGNMCEMLFFTVGFSYRHKQESSERLMLELKALRAQMNPHFIFNCMNTIDSYIFKRQPEQASKFLNAFSKLVRSILDHSEQTVIPLNKELATLKLFVSLEQERFDQSFSVEYCLAGEVTNGTYKIPPLLVQPYVENAIIHGLRNRKDKGGILTISGWIDGKQLRIIVKDNGIGRKAAEQLKVLKRGEHKSMALSLTQQRLERMPQKGKVEIIDIESEVEMGTEVRMALPLLN